MQQNFAATGPVVIGGVGGSGTRVAAEIVDQIGIYIGDDLNAAKDNRSFMLLFKRQGWHRKNSHNQKKIFTGLSLFTKAMLHRNMPIWPELKFLIQAVLEISLFGHNHQGDGRGIWPFLRAWHMFASRRETPSDRIGWGWKEPNTHIYLEDLATYYGHLKYIHLMRHGLDMAFSNNQQQLYNWGPLFGVQPPLTKADEAAASLKYWLRSNQRVLQVGQKLGRQKFLVVNYETLCLSPDSEIQKIISFLNIAPSAENLAAAMRIPRKPKSIGRYRLHDSSQFDPADIDALGDLGFRVGAGSE
jgi:hypothetical protein